MSTQATCPECDRRGIWNGAENPDGSLQLRCSTSDCRMVAYVAERVDGGDDR